MKELNKNTLYNALKKLPEYEPPELLWDEVSKDLSQVMPRTALQAAVQALPEYNPPAFVWDNIVQSLDKGLVENPLEETIQTLPEYDPPTTLWDNIENELDKSDSEEVLQKAIKALPEYEPAEMVWDNIEADLHRSKKRSAKIIAFKTWRRVAAAAVMMGFILTASWLYYSDYATSSDYTYSQEMVDERTFKVEWEADEQDFQTILAVCLQRKHVCEQPAFLNLKSELNELNEAKNELKTVLENYGKDPKLIQQLTKIEHQRSDVLKKMVVLI